MKDRNDFDFDDDFLNDDNEPFDFDDDESFPSGLGDEFESDMPVLEEEPEERGANRTFVFLAGLMIILFIAALAVVLFLATRPTGPTDLELTASQVVLLNLTVEAQLAETSTQNAINMALTQTAAAWTATPTVTQTPEPSETPTATQFRPTVTPTATIDETAMANAQLASGALTLTALAAQVTPTVEAQEVSLDLESAFATQLAFATQQGGYLQMAFGTQVAIATQIADTSLSSDAEAGLREALSGTQAAIDSQADAVGTAIAFIDNTLNESAVENPALATQLAIVLPAGLQTQAALGTPFAVATVDAASTQIALEMLIGSIMEEFPENIITPEPVSSGKLTEPIFTRAEEATQIAMLPLQQDATDAVVETREAFATQAAEATRSGIATQRAFATQQAFQTPPVFATQAAIATQQGLATRRALIDLALGIVPDATEGGDLDSVYQTATAIAGAFLTATAQAVTPGAITVTVPVQQVGFPTLAATGLPDTGLFDDVVSGGTGGVGVLALAVLGLVGVIVVSRRLRSENDRRERNDVQDAPQEPPKE